METHIQYRLEWDNHFWNFPTPEKAIEAKELYPRLFYDIPIKEITIVFDQNGVVLKKEEGVYNEKRRIY